MKISLIMSLCILFGLVACTDSSTEVSSTIRVELIDGNVRRTYAYEEAISVEEFLSRIQANVSDLDRVNPPRFTQIEDGMTITIVRVSEEVTCAEQVYSFETRRIPTDALDPGAEEIAQTGVNGVIQACQRCIFENGTQTSCLQTSQTVLSEPKEQIIYYGTGGVDVPIVIEGKIAFISNGQAWFIDGNVRNKRPITTEGRLDGRVFDLSPNGQQLLFTRQTLSPDDPDFANELWAILNTANPAPVQLLPTNVLSGGWFPAENYTVSYSTAEPRDDFPGWEAYNDLYKMRIDSQTGETVDFEDIVDVNAIGIYSYWGVTYQWSPDGSALAWSRADSIGLVDLESGDFITLAKFPHFDPAIVAKWVWQPKITWSADSQMLMTTLHGDPYGSESPVNSIVFDVAVLAPQKNLIIPKAITLAGIWAQPQYSPVRLDAANFPDYDIAYLQARDPLNNLGGEYDLMIADRDGSNPEVIFPPSGRQGIRPFNEIKATEFVWSPTGTHLAVIYQGNLWLVEVANQFTQQITTDGQSSHPRWAN